MTKHIKNILIRITAVLLIAAIFTSSGAVSYTPAEAATGKFKYKNLSTKETIKYEGTIPKVVINGDSFDVSDTPGIINSNGASMGNADAIFGDGCGAEVKFNKSKKRITFTLYEHKLVMYLDSTEATLDGKTITTTSAPYRIKYKKTGQTVTFVPTRFVAESLGCDYEWISETGTLSIKTPIKLTINGEDIYYNGTRGKVNIDGESLEVNERCSYIFDNTALCSIDPVLSAAGIYYDYDALTGKIDVSCGDININFLIDCPICYVNGFVEALTYSPKQIATEAHPEGLVYVPARFIFETFGFGYEWKSDPGVSMITSNENIGKYIENPSIFRLVDSGFTLFLPDEDYDFRQDFELPLPIDYYGDPTFTDMYYDNIIRVALEGDYTDFYSSCDIRNTGEAIIQIVVSYDDAIGSTVIDIHTRSNKDGLILSYKASVSDEAISFTIDRPKKLFKKIIVLDAGHGGTDPGTVNAGINEKDVNFSIVYTYCKELFDKSDIKVFYSRYDDTLIDLYVRAAFPTRVEADMFISVHNNYAWNTSTKGTSVYYSEKNESVSPKGLTSKLMHNFFLNNLVNDLGTKKINAGPQNYVVVRDTKVPAVLLEIGFLSNTKERKKLTKESYQKKIAKSIYNTVEELFDNFY